MVIYSLDARGLVASLSDISVPTAFDLTGRLDRANQGELVATQDAMNALARDTGGRPVFNTNALGVGFSTSTTGDFCLLPARLETESGSSGRQVSPYRSEAIGKAGINCASTSWIL